MQPLTSLDELGTAYDALLCDVWGVLHDGKRVFAPAAAALARARERGQIVVLLTNTPKPRDPIPDQLDRLGVPRAAWDVVVTSGDAIRRELAARAPGPMHRIGPEHDRAVWDGLGLELADVDTARFVCVSGLRDLAETPADYADELRRMRDRDLEMLCANPDVRVRFGKDLIWCAGALARDYRALGGTVVMAGKPHAPIYDLALGEIVRRRGRAVPRSRILCIGDGLETDVLGAQDNGFDCLFVASGMNGDLVADGRPEPARIAAAFAAHGVAARHGIAQLQ